MELVLVNHLLNRESTNFIVESLTCFVMNMSATRWHQSKYWNVINSIRNIKVEPCLFYHVCLFQSCVLFSVHVWQERGNIEIEDPANFVYNKGKFTYYGKIVAIKAITRLVTPTATLKLYSF